jgi:molybdopterin/thiamine biosynthesis adenylyltransferase
MNKAKILEYFNAAELISQPIHIVGCGAIGSHIAEQLARIGCTDIHLWDFDMVSPHNITNQMFTETDIGKLKTDSVRNAMCNISSELESTIHTHDTGWQGDILNGYVFLCVDNIDLRREIVQKNMYNPNCLGFFDFRMRLTDAQHYFAPRNDTARMKKLLDSMNFSHEEAKDATPKSACNTELSVITTVKVITAIGVNNFMKFVMDLPTKDMVLIDLNMLDITSFPQ